MKVSLRRSFNWPFVYVPITVAVEQRWTSPLR